MKNLIPVILLFLGLNSIHAQDNQYVYVEYDSLSNGYLEMKIDKKMDDLLETKKNRCNWTPPVNTNPTSNTPDQPVTFADLCREHPKMKGFRIQVVSTRSSEDAEKAQRKVQQQFPSLSSQVVSRMPQFRVLLGDYFTKENAARDLQAVKSIYPNAILVVSKIWCRRAK